MKNVIVLLFCVVSFLSCSDDDEKSPNLNDYNKVELDDSDCTDGYQEKGKVIKKEATVIFMEINNISFFLIKDKDGKEYFTCGLPEEYKKANLKIIFSGITYFPNPAALYFYNATDLKITDLWIKK